MVTLTYSNVDGVERISDGLQTYERAPIDIKPLSPIMHVSTTDLDFLVKHKSVTCDVKHGYITERIGDMWEAEACFTRKSFDTITYKYFYAFHKELFVRKRYCIFSAMSNGERSLYHVARFSTYANVWQPVSSTFKTFEEAKGWCNERCIRFSVKEL